MRGVMAFAVAMAVSATVDAEPSFVVPHGYRKQPGGEEYVARAHELKSTISVNAQAFRSPNGDVQLARISWRFKPEAQPTRLALEQFDRELAASSSQAVTKHVEDMRAFQGDQLQAEAVDEIDKLRVYHRRLYSVDTKGVVHLFWLICKGPATTIIACEQAQRTMKLVVANQATLPAPPKPPERPAPWSFVLPAGYTEVTGGLDSELATLRKTPDILYGDARMYESPDHTVRLIAGMALVLRITAPSWHDLEALDENVLADTKRIGTKHVSHARQATGPYLVANQIDEIDSRRGVQRRMYGVDVTHTVHVFWVMCFGVGDLTECIKAQDSMKLALPNQVEPITETSTASSESHIGRLIAGLASAAFVLALIIWISASARRGSRRRRRRRAH